MVVSDSPCFGGGGRPDSGPRGRRGRSLDSRIPRAAGDSGRCGRVDDGQHDPQVAFTIGPACAHAEHREPIDRLAMRMPEPVPGPAADERLARAGAFQRGRVPAVAASVVSEFDDRAQRDAGQRATLGRLLSIAQQEHARVARRHHRDHASVVALQRPAVPRRPQRIDRKGADPPPRPDRRCRLDPRPTRRERRDELAHASRRLGRAPRDGTDRRDADQAPDAADVVQVLMGYEQPVDPAHAGPGERPAQRCRIRPCVDQQRRPPVADEDRVALTDIHDGHRRIRRHGGRATGEGDSQRGRDRRDARGCDARPGPRRPRGEGQRGEQHRPRPGVGSHRRHRHPSEPVGSLDPERAHPRRHPQQRPRRPGENRLEHRREQPDA
jgi:hypothetical protein